MASDTGSSSRLIVRAATAALLSFVLLLPANAQFWGNSWGGRQQQPQQPYNPYAQQPYNPNGGFGGDRQWGYGGYPQRERPSSPRQRERPREVQKERPREVQKERPREVEKEQPPDYSHAPPATPRKDATVKVVVMGDANADWLAYGLEDAFSEKPEIGIVRKHRTDSGLIRYDQRRDSEWPQVAREIITAEKPKFVVMMIGNNDRQTIREKAPPPAPANAQPIQPPPAVPRRDRIRSGRQSNSSIRNRRRHKRARQTTARGSSSQKSGSSLTSSASTPSSPH
jgi:uncharacterized protein